MNIHYGDDHVTVHHGDCLDVMRGIPADSVDAIVTDPPYGLGFMGKAWDDLPPGLPWAQECLRILKPGGHLLAFGGTRTFHRLTCAIEDAGLEIRDSIAWLYGSGFPKSLDVSKAIDKVNGETGRLHRFTAWMRTTGLTARQLDKLTGTNMGGHYLTAASQPAIPTPALWATIRPHVTEVPSWVDELVARIAAEREVVGQSANGSGNGSVVGLGTSGNLKKVHDITAPATPAAQQWQGWGTALKPAFEPIVVARKPLTGTVAANVQAHGTGALNIDATRVGTTGGGGNGLGSHYDRLNDTKPLVKHGDDKAGTQGRWPTNVVLDGHAAAELDAGQPVTRQTAHTRRRAGGVLGNGVTHGDFITTYDAPGGYNDTGGPSRFFPVFRYQAKAPTRERPKINGVAHPTCKPLELMRWLVRLTVGGRPDAIVLDPFAGSGTTLEACLLEGVRSVGIERETDYLPLIMRRITRAYVTKTPADDDEDVS